MKSFVFGLFLIFACACGLSAAQQKHIADIGDTIASCEAVGRECKADGGTQCYGQYRACMKDGGL